jgi:aminomethyltransferase
MSHDGDESPKRTPLHALHERLGARMVPFAGWEMPVQYPTGILKEHAAAREGAALFDVSHMGQVTLTAREGGAEAAALALEALTPAALAKLASGRQRYCLLTTEAGGILDDLMVANRGDHLHLVVNAANAEADIAHLEARLSERCAIERLDRALIALQGPKAAEIVTACGADVSAMTFMDVAEIEVAGRPAVASRSGYTGEDGFEISLAPEDAEPVAEALIAAGATPAGLGARDSLRLEAGLPLHGSDIDDTTSPVEAALTFAVAKARRPGGDRPGGFPGEARILAELEDGPKRRRVGLRPEGRAPFRAHVPLYESETAAEPAGEVTSGAFGATAGGPVAMGYLPPSLAAPGREVWGEVRGKRLRATVQPLPFVPHRYQR